MPIQQVLRKLGRWDIRLKADAPPGVLSGLEFFGRVVVIPGRVNPVERGDECLEMARYVGVLRRIEGRDQATLSGSGMAFWLGDESDAGSIIEPPGITITGQTFANSIRALLPSAPADCVREGTLTAIAGSYSGTHEWQTRRAALDYVCDVFGGDWRVNGDATVDAGPGSVLFRSGQAVVARRDVAGYDMGCRALAGDLESSRDVSQYTTRVVVVADGYHIGDADAATVPYLDPFGNPVQFTRVADEQDSTEAVNADVRAALILQKYSGPRRQLRLSVDDFDVAGDVQPGDTVWVWDPDSGLTDLANELPFRGRLLNPASVRVLGLTWPVTEGHTVAFRNGDGSWVDLTPWVEWEAPSGGELEVADTAGPALTSSAFGNLGTVVSGTGTGGAGDASVPDVPVFGTFSGTSYQPADGLPRAAVQVTWSQPLNTDGSTIVDGDHYEVRYRPTGTTGWEVAYAAWSSSSLTVSNLPPSTGYDWQIRAVDYAAPVNEGAWSTTTTYSTPADTTAPSTPAPPTVAASLIAVQVTHTLGLASGGTYNLPLDMDHFEVHVDTSSGFTPSSASLVGKLRATSVELAGSIPVVGTFQIDTLVAAGVAAYVRVVAVDRTGNRSTASSAATATAQLIDSAHITSLTASKITAGSITAAVVIGGSATFSGALSAATGTFAGSLSAATGTFAGSLSAATGTFTGSLSGNSISGATITGGTVQTAASGSRVVMSSGAAQKIDFYSSSGDHGYIQANNAGSNQLGLYSDGGSSVLIYNGTVSLNVSGGVVSVNSSGGTIQSTGNSTFVLISGTTATLDASGTVAIGNGGFSNTINIGSSSSTLGLGATTINLSNITGTSASTALTMVGRRLYFVTSTRRNKVDIRPAEITPQDVLRLRPVTYHDRSEVEAAGTTDGVRRNLGLIAEDVAEIEALDHLLVVRDDDGEPISLGYDRIPVVQQILIQDHEARLRQVEALLAGVSRTTRQG